MHKFNLPGVFGGGGCKHVVEDGQVFVVVACHYPDGAASFVENSEELCTDATVATRDDEDFAVEGGEVGFCEGGFGGEELGVEEP